MTACSVGELAPDARAALDAYLDGVGATLDADLRDAVLCDLRSWLLDHLTPDSTAADVAAVVARVGPVDSAAPDPGARRGLRGRILGVPYDLTPPTWRRVARRLWDPADPALWRAHLFGAGWTPNFGAFAVRLGLIEPDAEDEPFTSTPPAAFAAAAAVPAALAAATVLHYAVRGRTLPDSLPGHWGFDGSPDAWTTKRAAAASDLALTVLPALAAAWATASGRPGQARAGALAAASGLAVVGAITTVVRPLAPRPRPWFGPGLVTALVAATGGTLLGLARAGRRAEQRRDLEGR